ncbi:MAG TPA: helix-turn-helix domain-containing protein [Pyrinomonadaceae bacterium]|nr:helix-turn-helix domain-containing protein [Pyrinomonadaceae bacterium]
MRRREGDGCPVWGALQVVGDKWTLLIVRDLARGARRTTDILTRLHPISSRTLADRLRDMVRDSLIERRDLGGSPPHVEYLLTERGRRLMPLLEALRAAGEALDCNACDERLQRQGSFCDFCPRRERPAHAPSSRRATNDDSIVLL